VFVAAFFPFTKFTSAGASFHPTDFLPFLLFVMLSGLICSEDECCFLITEDFFLQTKKPNDKLSEQVFYQATVENTPEAFERLFGDLFTCENFDFSSILLHGFMFPICNALSSSSSHIYPRP
jgi:hypothetical protein